MGEGDTFTGQKTQPTVSKYRRKTGSLLQMDSQLVIHHTIWQLASRLWSVCQTLVIRQCRRYGKGCEPLTLKRPPHVVGGSLSTLCQQGFEQVSNNCW